MTNIEAINHLEEMLVTAADESTKVALTEAIVALKVKKKVEDNVYDFFNNLVKFEYAISRHTRIYSDENQALYEQWIDCRYDEEKIYKKIMAGMSDEEIMDIRGRQYADRVCQEGCETVKNS